VSRLDTDSAHLATDLWVADPDGPALRRLTTGREWDEAPAVAPGGRRVAFVRRAVSGVPDGRLWVVNADGTGLRPVFAPAARDALGGEDVAPAWSPDGRTLAFVSNRAGDGYRPYLADADGSNVRPVGTAGEERWRTFRTLSWAPDGTRLVAGAWHGPNDLSALAVLTLATGQATHVLSQSGATVEAPAWSPDGQRLLYVSDQDGRPQLYAATLGVADKARLVASDARDTDPTWAPDGARIAFLRRASGDNPRVFIVRADGSGARALTAGARWVDFGVAWR
jgi:TolB protein